MTSRNQLSGLVAVDGGHSLSVEPLSPTEARALLAARLGHRRVKAEPAAVDEIISRCAGLPLALAILAGRGAIHPRFPLSALVDELRSAPGRLDGFDRGEPSSDVRTVFSWSYRTLSPAAARLFRWLGRQREGDMVDSAVAVLAGLPEAKARRLLAELTDANMITEHSPGRYALHPLLRAYACELAHTHDSGMGRTSARARSTNLRAVRPWRRETFKFSTDPELEAKVRDVVGLYLNPPEKAIVLCVDEKSQVQALDRTAPILPLRPGLPERATHDYKRNGTTNLFAALEVATGRITDRCYDRHGKAEFLDFLKRVARAYPRRELHVVLDNYHTHKHDDIQGWLAKHPRVTLHYTPTSGSWLNLVEVFFGLITRQAIRRGSFASVPHLVGAIRTFIDGWNERCHPFTWTKTADEILPHATRQRYSDAGH